MTALLFAFLTAFNAFGLAMNARNAVHCYSHERPWIGSASVAIAVLSALCAASSLAAAIRHGLLQ